MTSKQYWEHKFGEPPKTDADKLACAMMAEYHRHERQQLIDALGKLLKVSKSEVPEKYRNEYENVWEKSETALRDAGVEKP